MCACLLGRDIVSICVSVSARVLLVSVVVCMFTECVLARGCRARACVLMCVSSYMLVECSCLHVGVGCGRA